MIKFLGLGGKKEEKLGKGFIPTDRVKELSEKGFSEPEIIDVLRKEGFSADEIDRALTQALKIGVTGEPEAPTKLPTIEDLQASTSEKKPKDEMPTPQVPEVPERSLQYPEYYPGYGTEEMVEAIVRERMGEMEQTLSEFRAKYAELERKIANLHHQLSILSKSKSEFEQLLISKLDAQKDTLDDVNARLSSLEKAFKEALPALIESVRSLSDLVQRFKKE